MCKKPCSKCPFGENAEEVWEKGIREEAVGVVGSWVKSGFLKPNEPQVCHSLLASRGDNYIEPKSPDEICIGHQQFLNNNCCSVNNHKFEIDSNLA